jgi:hypothetical protein
MRKRTGFLRTFRIQRSTVRSEMSWQNGVVERFVGNCRCDLLDHVIVLNERHLKRLMTDYLRYYHHDRTHLGLAKQTPGGRVAETPRVLRAGLFPSREWAGCTIATNLRLELAEICQAPRKFHRNLMPEIGLRGSFGQFVTSLTRILPPVNFLSRRFTPTHEFLAAKVCRF